MTDRTVHLPVAAQPTVESFVELTRAAETAGYHRAWLPETWGRDAVTILSQMASATDTIGIGPSILNVYSRSPTLLAQTAATLQEVGDGRVRMGIGPSGPAVIEGWHGIDFDRPLRRTRETLEIMQLALAGERVDYDGDIFSLAGFRLRSDPPTDPVAIDVAAMGPTAVEMAGRFASGWHATVFTPDGLADRMDDLERGADLADRALEDCRVTLSLTCCALEDGEQARALARRHVAFYLGAMGTYYRDSLARQGYEGVAETVASAWANGDRKAAAAAIDDELLDSLCAAGTPERARNELEKFEQIDGLDSIAVGLPRGADRAAIDATIAALAPS